VQEREWCSAAARRWLCSCWCVASLDNDDGGSRWREVLMVAGATVACGCR